MFLQIIIEILLENTSVNIKIMIISMKKSLILITTVVILKNSSAAGTLSTKMLAYFNSTLAYLYTIA